VSFTVTDPAAAKARCAEAGIIVRDLPGTPYLRASVGAWNDEGDLDRLLGAVFGAQRRSDAHRRA
jgi:L-cysteine/cystine lyase